MRLRKRKIFIILIAGLLLAGGLYFLKENAAAPADAYVKPHIDTITDIVTAQGTLEPKNYVNVGAQVSGQLKKIYFEIGDTVEKGDLLAEIDPQIYQATVQASEARISSLQAQLRQQEASANLAKQQNERNQLLIKSDAISREALEVSASNLRVAEESVRSVQAQIQQEGFGLKGEKANLGYTKIYAPMSGTITTLPVREGQTINSFQEAPTILQIADLDVMTVRAKIAEGDVMNITSDTAVFFTTLGSYDRQWDGKVRQVLPSPDIINDVVLYSALIDVDNTARELMNGMSTQVFFVLSSAEKVPVIPVNTLGKLIPEKSDVNGLAYMVKTRKGVKMVKIGLMDREIAQVKSGLDADDEVMLPPKPQAKKAAAAKGVPRL